MDIHDSITDIQQGMRIIKEVGEPHQYKVIDMLIGLTYYGSEIEEERKAQKVIDNVKNVNNTQRGGSLSPPSSR